MSHDEAIKSGATERYVLDDMTDEERDAFEEHYFDCAVCAEDVRAAIALRDALAAEKVTSQPAVVPIQPRQRQMPAWLASAAAAAMIAVVSMYAGVVQPERKQLAAERAPRIVEEYSLESVRGENEAINHRESFVLNIDLQTEDRSPRYDFVVLDAAGRKQFGVPVDGERARTKRISVRVAGGTLGPGNYTLRVDGTEPGVATYPFVMR